MQTHTLYIYLTDSALFLATEGSADGAQTKFGRHEIGPDTPFAALLNKAAAQKEGLLRDTDRVRVIVDSPTLIIPMSEFSEDNFRKYYDYCIPSQDKRRIFCDPLPAANAMLAFSVAENIFNTLCDRFENVHFCSSMTCVAGHFIKKSVTAALPKRMLTVVREGAADIIAVESGRLLAANSFEVGAESDIIYFTLGTASKLGISVRNDAFYLAGDAAQRESVGAELRKYAQNVCVVRPEEEFGEQYADIADDVPFNMLAALAES